MYFREIILANTFRKSWNEMNDMNHENVGCNGDQRIIENHDKMEKYYWKLLELFSIEYLMCNGYWAIHIIGDLR